MEKNSYSGKFIVIEGLDGAGKTAQAVELADFLRQAGKDVFATKEPTVNSDAGKKIKQILRGEISASKLGLQELFVQDRKEHLEKEIIPALRQGKSVVCERYVFSTIAYGASEELSVDLLAKMNDNFLLPDLTVFIDVSPESCVKRIESRGDPKELFEKKEKLERVAKIYKEIAVMFTNFIIIDGEKSKDEVAEEIKNIIKSKFL